MRSSSKANADTPKANEHLAFSISHWALIRKSKKQVQQLHLCPALCRWRGKTTTVVLWFVYISYCIVLCVSFVLHRIVCVSYCIVLFLYCIVLCVGHLNQQTDLYFPQQLPRSQLNCASIRIQWFSVLFGSISICLVLFDFLFLVFLDAIASPCTYPCQWVSQSVSGW